MITLYFLRHAKAHDLSSSGDFYRELTVEGVAQAKKVAEFCKNQNISFDKVLVSPLTRAVQTASALVSTLKNCPPPVIVDWLELDKNINYQYNELTDLIKKSEKVSSVLLISHEPNISGLITLLFSEIGHVRPFLRIRKASLTAIKFPSNEIFQPQLVFTLPVQLM